MQGSDTPDWLRDDGSSPAPPAAGAPETLEAAPTTDEATKKTGSSRSRCPFSFGAFSVGLISLALLALFAFSATVQDNDVDGLVWIVFYACNATVPAAFLVYYTCCFPLLPVYLLSIATATWSIVFIVIAALKVNDTPAGGATDDDTGDNDNQTLRQELVFELAGSSLALFSSLYHIVMARCCVKKDKKENAEGKAEPEAEDV